MPIDKLNYQQHCSTLEILKISTGKSLTESHNILANFPIAYYQYLGLKSHQVDVLVNLWPQFFSVLFLLPTI